jgi:hypothetical protein
MGSLIMIAGAVAISSAVASESEQAAVRGVMARECDRYGLDLEVTASAQLGKDPLGTVTHGRRWWDYLIVALATGAFVWLARYATRPPLAMAATWIAALVLAMLAFLVGCGCLLWKYTRFS